LNPEDFAIRLREAHNSKTAIAPLRNEIGTEDIDFAYKIQEVNTQFRLGQGARITGKKIGLTSLAVQKQLGVDQPDFGILFSDMEILNGLSVSMKDLMQPKAEAEIAFILGEDLDDDRLTIVDIMNAIDYALPAIEIVGSRIENWDIRFTDTVADNASASHYVIGHSPRTLDEFDMVNCQMNMFNHAKKVSSGTGAACMGSPLNATLWLANKMAQLGNPLQAGELIFSGALGPMFTVSSGDSVKAEFDGLGTVSVNFSE